MRRSEELAVSTQSRRGAEPDRDNSRQASFREPARRRGRGSASHLAICDSRPAGETGFLPRASSTTRETHLPARCRRRSKSPLFAMATRIPRLPMRFRAAPSVASLAMARSRKPVSPAATARVRSLSAHGNATCGVSRGEHLPARCRRRSRSPLLRRRHADPTPPDAFPCYAARRVARDGSLQEACRELFSQRPACFASGRNRSRGQDAMK